MTENGIDNMVARWEALHATPHFSPQYPTEIVIRWTFRNFARDRADTYELLDVGAGAGRHTVFWARQGYRTQAVDASALAVAQTLQWGLQENLAVAAQVAEADALPFADGRFDGVLSFAVLYYLSYERLQCGIQEIWRVLKPGGRAFVMIKSDADSRARGARKVAAHAYQVATPENGESWTVEAGMVLTLLDRSAVEAAFAMFSEVLVDRSTATSGSGRFIDDDWLIQVRK